MESRRIINRNLLFVMIVIVLCNYVLFIKQQADDGEDFYETNTYSFYEFNALRNDLYKELQGVDRSEYKSYLSQWYQEIIEQSEEKKIIARDVNKSIRKQIDYIDSYERELDERIAKAEEMVTISLYSDSKSFGYHNLLKTRYDLKKLYGLQLGLSSYTALDKFFEFGMTKYFLILLMVLTILAMKVNGSNLQDLIMATPKGRLHLCVRRCKIVMGLALLYSVVLYLPMIITSFIMYGGLESIFDLIQSNVLNQFSPIVVTNGVYLIVFVLLQALGAFVIGQILWAIISVIRSENAGVAGFVAFLAIEFGLYIISINNPVFQFLRWCNIFAFVDWHIVLSQYMNVGTGSLIVLRLEFVAVSMVVTAIIGVAVNLVFSKRNIGTRTNRALSIGTGKIFATCNNFCKELYKSLIAQKGIIVLAAFGIYVIMFNVGGGTVYKEDYELIVNDYYKSVRGDAYEASDACIQKLETQLLALNNEKNTDASMIDDYRKALEKIKQQVTYVRQLNESGVDAVIVNEYLIESRYKRMNKCYGNLSFTILVAVFCLFYKFFVLEKSNDMWMLIGSSKKAQRFMFQKIGVVSLITVASVLFAKFMADSRLAAVYPMNEYELRAAVQSASFFGNASMEISFQMLDVIITICHIVGYLMVSYVVMAFSLFRNRIFSLLVQFVVIPYGLWYIGMSIWEKFSIVPYITVIGMLEKGTPLGVIMAGWVVVLIIGIASVAAVNKKWRYV